MTEADRYQNWHGQRGPGECTVCTVPHDNRGHGLDCPSPDGHDGACKDLPQEAKL